MVRSKGPKWSNIQQRQQRQHPPIPCALRAQFSVAERYLGFVTVTLSWRCVLIDLQGKPWLNWLSQLHAIPILNLLMFEKTLQWTIQWLYSTSYLLTILHMIFTAKPSLRDAKHFNRGRYLTSWHPGMNSKTCPYRDSRTPKNRVAGRFLRQSWSNLKDSTGAMWIHLTPFNQVFEIRAEMCLHREVTRNQASAACLRSYQNPVSRTLKGGCCVDASGFVYICMDLWSLTIYIIYM